MDSIPREREGEIHKKKIPQNEKQNPTKSLMTFEGHNISVDNKTYCLYDHL